MVKIAVLGHGTVGEGICRIIDNPQPIENYCGRGLQVKYILEQPAYPKNDSRIIYNVQTIIDDPEIEIVAEAIGGTDIPFLFLEKCLKAGKSVVTSNKELVAEHGARLIKLAFSKKVNFLFEASVGGAIPVLRSIRNSFASGQITGVEAILNGTTNYILTKMKEEGLDFQGALKQAQRLGYAEANPKNDLEGLDTARKLAIILSLITGKETDYTQIPCRGIGDISLSDMEAAAKLNMEIKLAAVAQIHEDGVFAFVSPVLVKKENPLYGVRDVFNGITLKYKEAGDIMLYGRGAGKMPSASAVVDDIIDCVKYKGISLNKPWEGKLEIKAHMEFEKYGPLNSI